MRTLAVGLGIAAVALLVVIAVAGRRHGTGALAVLLTVAAVVAMLALGARLAGRGRGTPGG